MSGQPAAPGAAPAPQVTPTAAPPAAQPPAPAPQEWNAGFSDDVKGYVQNKGWKNPQEVVESYRNFEKLQGVPQDRILKLPESADAPEFQAVWERLGKPKEAKDYGLKVPEKGGDPKLAEWAAEVFHKGNLTTKQAEAVMSAWNARQEQVAKQTMENQKIALSQATDRLKTEWGAAYDQKMNLAKAGVAALKLDAQTVDLIASIQGADVLFKRMAEIGAGIGESAFIAGRPAPDGTITPEQAKSELKTLMQDTAWRTRYLAGDSDAKKKMEHLQRMANPGEIRLT